MPSAPQLTPIGSRHGDVRRRLAQGTALAVLLTATPAIAQTLPNPSDGTPVVPGSATITKAGTTLTVTVSPTVPRTVINWTEFNVGVGETAEFRDSTRVLDPLPVAQPLAVLNRVIGTPGAAGGPRVITQSQILGNLVSDSNIAVYLLNPQGVLFGARSVVNVGSLIASSRDVFDTSFGQFLAGGPLQLAGTTNAAVEVRSGAQLNAIAQSRGVIALIGAKVETRGALTATGDIALVAADDATINFSSGSPLAVTITAGTALSDPIVARNSLTGSTVLLAAATRASVTSALLDVQATVTATTAFATDQGIVLAAGATSSLAPNITMATDIRADNTGALSLTLGGSLTATGAAGRIDVRARNGVAAPTSPAVAATLSADRSVLVRADAGGVVLGDVTARLASTTANGVDISAGAGAVTAGNVAAGTASPADPGATGARASVVADAGAVTLASLFASQAATVSGTSVTAGAVRSEAATLDVTTSAGDLTATSLTAFRSLTATATGGDLIVDSAVSQASNADVDVSAVAVRGRTGARATLTAGRDLDVGATGVATLATASAGRDATVSATTIDATSLSAVGALDATATTGALALGSASAGDRATLFAAAAITATGTVTSTDDAIEANGASIDVDAVDAETTLDLTSTTGALILGAGSVGTIATLDAATNAEIGTLDAGRIGVNAAGTVDATRLTATQNGGGDAIFVTGASIDVGTAEATTSTARLTSLSGDATVGTLDAGRDAILSSSARATLANADAGRDLIVSGTEIRLGGGPAPVQSAGRRASYTASTGTIAGTSATTGLVIRADAAATGAGAIILDANTGIDLPGVRLVTGDPAESTNTGDIGIRLATAGAPLVLSAIDARALLSVDAAQTGFSPLTTDGDVSLGATRLVDSLAINTPGAISLASVAISGAGETLSVTGSGPANTITATGGLSALAGVTVLAPGAVTIAGVSGGTGAADIRSTGATLTAGAVTGATVTARAQGAASVGSLIASTGGATISSQTAGITVSGETRAAGTVTFDAPGTIQAADVRSTGDTVVFQSTVTPATGAIVAGAVRASSDLTVARGAGLSFGSATSDNGAVSLVSASGPVAVSGPTNAETSVLMSGTSVSTGSVTADNGAATLTATATNVAATGAILASGQVTVTAPGAMTLGDVRSTGADVILSPGAGALTAGIVRAASDLLVDRDNGFTLGGAVSDTGTVTLRALNGGVVVTGATRGQGAVAATGRAVTLGAVTSEIGGVSLTSTVGVTTAGAIDSELGVLVRGVSGVALASVASATGAVDLASSAGNLGVTGPITAAAQVDARSSAAGASTTLGDVTSTGAAVLLEAAGGRLTAGTVAARGSAVASGTAGVSIDGVASTVGGVSIAATAGDVTATGAIAGETDVAISARDAIAVNDVTSFGAAVSILGSAAIDAGDVLAATALEVGGDGGVTLGAVTSTASSVILTSGGGIDAAAVSAATSADIAAQAGVSLDRLDTATGAGSIESLAGAIAVSGPVATGAAFQAVAPGAITLGDVTARGGAIGLDSGAALSAGAVVADAALTASGAAGITLGSARSVTSTVTMTSTAGPLGVAGLTRAAGDVGLTAQGPLTLGDVTSDTGDVNLRSTNGGAAAAAVDAGGGVDVAGLGLVTLDAIDARGASAAVTSSAGGVTIGQVTTLTTLDADAAAGLSITTATVGADATLAGADVTLGTITAGSLTATARGGDLSLTDGEIVGDATLAKTGATGTFAVTRLGAGGTMRLTSASGVRADRLEGGAAFVTAAGAVTGAGGGLSADVASLDVDAGGAATIGAVTTTGDVDIAAGGAAALADAVASGGDLVILGSAVTLGSATGPIGQSAAGRIDVTSTSGAITGLAGLTLRSDTGGAGGGDLTLRSAAGVAFQPGTLLAGGPDRQSALRLAAGAGAGIVLDAVEARTIASPGAATQLTHAGPITIRQVAARDSLSIATTGASGSSLAIGTVEVRAGDLALDAAGALTTGGVTATGGATTLAGSSVTSGAIATRGVSATARTGAATFSTIDASAGGIAATAATDLRLARGTATGDVTLTSAGGDITGGAVAGGFAPALLSSSGGRVVLRADASDGIGGAILLDSVTGAGGIDLAGRTITATALTASGGGVVASTRRDGAAFTNQALTIGSINALGGIALSTGNATAPSNGAVTLGSASAGGQVTIDATGAIDADTITGAAATLTARRIAVTTTTAGALRATAGPDGLDLRTATVAGAAAITSQGGVAFGALDAGSATIDAVGVLTADRIAARSGLSVTASEARIATTAVAGGATRIATAAGLTLETLSAAGDLDASTSGALTAGALDVGGAATLTATGGLTINALRSGRATVRGATVAIGDATAADLTIAATAGDIRLGTAASTVGVSLTSTGASAITGAVTAGTTYRVEASAITLGAAGATVRQAAGDVTLVARTGAVTGQGSATLAAARTVAVTANGASGAISFAPGAAITGGGDVTLATTGAAALGGVASLGGALRIDAIDAALSGQVTGRSVTLANVATAGVTRLGDTAVGNEAEFAAGATRFDLTNAELALVSAPEVTIASGARDVVVGAVGLAAATGSTRFAIGTSGRIDMLGRFVAAGSPATRTIAFGAGQGASRTAVLRVAATQTDGGRLIVDGATLELAADRIGVGLDRDFLDPIGYRATGIEVDRVTRDYVARPTSTLYNASALGAAPYVDRVLIRSGALSLTYGRYALIQNTGRPGEQTGVELGGATATATATGARLTLAAPGSASNAFALFGTIDGVGNQATALLGGDRLSVDPTISPVASRVNGCIIGSGAGCLNTSIAQPSLALFDTSRAEIVRTAEDLTLPFDPLIGTNNEALYLDSDPGAAPAAECQGDQPCPTQP